MKVRTCKVATLSFTGKVVGIGKGHDNHYTYFLSLPPDKDQESNWWISMGYYYKVCKDRYTAFYYDPFGDRFVMVSVPFASPKLCRAYLEGINVRQNQGRK